MLRIPTSVSVPGRLRFDKRPENNLDFVKYEYGNAPLKIVGMWKIHHGYDFGPEQLDYEDHSMHMLHQRPGHWRSFGAVVGGVASLIIWYLVWTEFPFPGIAFGQSYMDTTMNAIKYVNYDEGYHNWDKLYAEYKKSQEEPPEEEEEEVEEEEVAEESQEAASDDLEEVASEE
jgi:hypothetical protein